MVLLWELVKIPRAIGRMGRYIGGDMGSDSNKLFQVAGGGLGFGLSDCRKKGNYERARSSVKFVINLRSRHKEIEEEPQRMEVKRSESSKYHRHKL